MHGSLCCIGSLKSTELSEERGRSAEGSLSSDAALESLSPTVVFDVHFHQVKFRETFLSETEKTHLCPGMKFSRKHVLKEYPSSLRKGRKLVKDSS